MSQSNNRWTATIGWMKPGAVDKTVQDLFQMAPADVNVSIHTNFWSLKMVTKERYDPQRFDGLTEDLVSIAQDLVRYQNPDCIAVTGDLIQAAMGVRWNRELRDRVQDATGRPAQTGLTAVTDALGHLGVEKVALASPYREDHREHEHQYLEEAGFQITSVEGFEGTNSLADIRALPEDAPFECGRRAFEAAPGAKAIFVACPVWAADRNITRLEEACGVPVITMLNSMLWRALTNIGYSKPVHGFGRLLASVGV